MLTIFSFSQEKMKKYKYIIISLQSFPAHGLCAGHITVVSEGLSIQYYIIVQKFPYYLFNN